MDVEALDKSVTLLDKLQERNYINDFRQDCKKEVLPESAGLRNQRKLAWIIEAVKDLKLKERKISFIFVCENQVLRLRASFNWIDSYSIRESHELYYPGFMSLYPPDDHMKEIEKLYIVDEDFLGTNEGIALAGCLMKNTWSGHVSKVFLPTEVQNFLDDFYRDGFFLTPVDRSKFRFYFPRKFYRF